MNNYYTIQNMLHLKYPLRGDTKMCECANDVP